MYLRVPTYLVTQLYLFFYTQRRPDSTVLVSTLLAIMRPMLETQRRWPHRALRLVPTRAFDTWAHVIKKNNQSWTRTPTIGVGHLIVISEK